MKKFGMFVAAVGVLGSLVACAPKATRDEAVAACMTQANLEKAANPAPMGEDPVAKVDADFQAKRQEIQTQMDQATAGIDTEWKAKIDAAKKDAEKATLTEEYNKAREAKVAEFAPQMQALEASREDAMKGAAEAKAKQEEDAKKAAEEKNNACADAMVQAGGSQAKAQCQAKAGSMDEFNACK